MATDIYMPQLGLTMTEGKIVRWLKAEGDPVRKSEPLLEVETDKVIVEAEAQAEGVLGPILAMAGTTVPIGGLLGHILAPGEVAPSSSVATVAPFPTSLTSAPPAVTRPAAFHRASHPSASPRARRRADGLGIELAQIQGTGPGGRIVEADVQWHAEHTQTTWPKSSPLAQQLARDLGVNLTQIQGTGPRGRILQTDVRKAAASAPSSASPVALPLESGEFEPLQGARRVMADRMTHSFTTTPHFYLSVQVEATALIKMRAGLLAKVEVTSGAHLTVTDLLVKICAQALREFPAVNAAWAETADGVGVIRKSEVIVGIAVALDNGLVVPVMRQADRLALSDIARQRTDLVARARAGKLTLGDLEGGTFTLSNLGMYNIDQFHAILNPPQSAILAVGRIKERPLAMDSNLVVRPTVNLTLSVDHRVLDGAQGARFLDRVAQLVQEPYLLV